MPRSIWRWNQRHFIFIIGQVVWLLEWNNLIIRRLDKPTTYTKLYISDSSFHFVSFDTSLNWKGFSFSVSELASDSKVILKICSLYYIAVQVVFYFSPRVGMEKYYIKIMFENVTLSKGFSIHFEEQCNEVDFQVWCKSVRACYPFSVLCCLVYAKFVNTVPFERLGKFCSNFPDFYVWIVKTLICLFQNRLSAPASQSDPLVETFLVLGFKMIRFLFFLSKL